MTTEHPHPCKTCGTRDTEAFDTPAGAWCRDCWAASLQANRDAGFARMAERPAHKFPVFSLTGRRRSDR
jgi:hypothetical protein